MNKLLALLAAIILIPWILSSCASTDSASDLIVPDRDKEGLTGPGIRMTDNQMNTNRVEGLTRTEYTPPDVARRQEEQPVDGVDFFQYKKKF